MNWAHMLSKHRREAIPKMRIAVTFFLRLSLSFFLAWHQDSICPVHTHPYDSKHSPKTHENLREWTFFRQFTGKSYAREVVANSFSLSVSVSDHKIRVIFGCYWIEGPKWILFVWTLKRKLVLVLIYFIFRSGYSFSPSHSVCIYMRMWVSSSQRCDVWAKRHQMC